MATATLSPTDVAALIGRLTSAEVRARLDVLDAERRTLSTLLRSLRARERAAVRRREAARA